MNRLNAHLQQVEESYLQHMKHALSFAFSLGFASFVCLIHAFMPFLFEKQGSQLVSQLHDKMVTNRHKHQGSKKNQNKRWSFTG